MEDYEGNIAFDVYVLVSSLVCGLYPEADMGTIYKRLVEVANGEVSVHNSPEEELAKLEARSGPMPEDQRSRFLAFYKDRRSLDEANQAMAKRIVAVFEADRP